MVFFRSLFILFLLFCGTSLVYFHEEVIEYYDKNFGPKDERPVVAKVESPSGTVRFKLPKTLIYKKVKKGQELRLRDTITTDSDSKLKLNFVDGLELEVGENSFIVLDNNSDNKGQGLKISFLRGNFKVLKKGTAGKNTLIKKGTTSIKEDIVIDPAANKSFKPIVISSKQSKEFQKLLDEKNQLLSRKNTPEMFDEESPDADVMGKTEVDPVKIQGKDSNNVETKQLSKAEEKERIKKIQFKTREEKETLPESYIVDTIQKQKPFFNRCYAQHLRLNPEAQGRIDFSFTISASGKVIDVRILRATINDPRLHQCSMSVLERSEFRAFGGDPIVVNYPIYFE